MNQLRTLFTFLLLLSFFACKRDIKVEPEELATVLPCDQNTPTFSRPVNVTDQFYAIVEDLQRNIMILGQRHLIKYDYNGNLVWSRDISISGKPQCMIQADGDNYFTTNSNIDIVSQTSDQYTSADPADLGKTLNLTSYKRAVSLNDDCGMYYETIRKDFGSAPDHFVCVKKPVNNSKCYLNKFDRNGMLLWSKTFGGNYFAGKNICKTADGNYVLITLTISGSYQTARFDANGVFQDTINRPVDQNRIDVYKFDRNGNVIWTKSIDGIIVRGYPQEDNLDFTGLQLASAQNTLFIQTSKQLFILNENGNVIRSQRPFETNCRGTGFGLSSFNDRVYSTGSSQAPPEYFQFEIVYDAAGNKQEQIYHDNVFGVSSHTFPMSDGIVCLNFTLSKTDRNDNKLWSVPLDRFTTTISCANRTCREGMVYITTALANGKSTLVKTNRNGTY